MFKFPIVMNKLKYLNIKREKSIYRYVSFDF